MKKVLSVIIPTYNMEKYLNKCLDSFILSDEIIDCLEVIIVNDGSKDSSLNIALEYSRLKPNTFIVIDKQNGNYGSCINQGLKVASGKYIKVVDADDYVCNSNWGNFLKLLSQRNEDLIVTDVATVNSKGETDGLTTYKLPKNKTLRFVDFCTSRTFVSMQMHGVTYKRSIFEDLCYIQSEGISFTDQEWMLYPMVRVETIFYYPICIYQYLVGREGQTIADVNYTKVLDQHKIIIYRALRELSVIKLDTARYTYFTNRLFELLLFFYRKFLLLDSIDIIKKLDREVAGINPLFSSQMEKLPLMYSLLPYHFIKDIRKNRLIKLSIMTKIYKLMVKCKA